MRLGSIRGALACLVLLGCGGGQTGAQSAGEVEGSEGAGERGRSSGAESEGGEVGAPSVSCDDGSCFRCGDGICPKGFYCDRDAQGGPACGWLPACASEPSCSCLKSSLGASCECSEEAGGVSLDCP